MAIRVPAPVREVLKREFGVSRFSDCGESVKSRPLNRSGWRLWCDGERLSVWTKPLDRKPRLKSWSVMLDGDVSAWCDDVKSALALRERELAERG